MQTSPATDKTFGISLNNDCKFSEVRHKAMRDYQLRKAKRDKKQSPYNLPIYKPGDLVVLSTQKHSKEYVLVEVVDFNQSNEWGFHKKLDFEYFGIVLNLTSKDTNLIIGRMISFKESGNYWSRYKPEAFKDNGIKWPES